MDLVVQSQLHITDLPDDQLLEIFHLLPISTRLHSQSVCSRWRSLLRQSSLWSHLDLADVPHFSAHQISKLIHLSRTDCGGFDLVSIDASGCWALDLQRLLPLLRACPRLHHISALGNLSGRPLVRVDCLSDLIKFSGNPTCDVGPHGKLGDHNRPSAVIPATPALDPLVVQTSAPPLFLAPSNGSMPRGSNSTVPRISTEPDRDWPLDRFRFWFGSGKTDSPAPPRGVTVEVDLEVDWCPIEELGVAESKLSSDQWESVLTALGSVHTNLRIRALYLEIFSPDVLWPRLLGALRTNTSLTELHLVSVSCDPEVQSHLLSSLAEALDQNEYFRTLHLKYKDFGSLPAFQSVIRICQVAPAFRKLELEDCAYSEGIDALLANLIDLDTPLEELVLCPPPDLGCLCDVLPRSTSLKILRVGGTSAADMHSLASCLPHCLSLRELDLRGNALREGPMSALVAALPANSSIQRLRLDGCTYVDSFPTARVLETLESLCAAVRQRGGVHTLGVTLPIGFWQTPAKAGFFTVPRRFRKPRLAQLVDEGAPSVTTLHVTSPLVDWERCDAAAWKLWFGLTQARNFTAFTPETLLRKKDEATCGVVLELHSRSGGGVPAQIWTTHCKISGTTKFERNAHPPIEERIMDLLFLVFYPLVLLWDTIDSMYHVDFRGFNILDWLFRAPLIISRVVGLLATLAVINVLMFAQGMVASFVTWVIRNALVILGTLGMRCGGEGVEKDLEGGEEASSLLPGVV